MRVHDSPDPPSAFGLFSRVRGPLNPPSGAIAYCVRSRPWAQRSTRGTSRNIGPGFLIGVVVHTMSSGFVSEGGAEESAPRDNAWLKVQRDLEAKRAQKIEQGKQEGGKSLYEVLQQNKGWLLSIQRNFPLSARAVTNLAAITPQSCKTRSF